MEIEWGGFYFSCEKTAAILLAAAPVVLIMQLPIVARGLRKAILLIKWRRRKQYPYV